MVGWESRMVGWESRMSGGAVPREQMCLDYYTLNRAKSAHLQNVTFILFAQTILHIKRYSSANMLLVLLFFCVIFYKYILRIVLCKVFGKTRLIIQTVNNLVCDVLVYWFMASWCSGAVCTGGAPAMGAGDWSRVICFTLPCMAP